MRPRLPVRARRPWGRAAAWVAIYNAETVAHFHKAALYHAAIIPYQLGADHPAADAVLGPADHVIGMEYVTGSRQIRWADVEKAHAFEAGCFVWTIAHHVRFRRPLSLEAAGLKRKPHGVVYVEGAILRAAMERP